MIIYGSLSGQFLTHNFSLFLSLLVNINAWVRIGIKFSISKLAIFIAPISHLPKYPNPKIAVNLFSSILKVKEFGVEFLGSGNNQPGLF